MNDEALTYVYTISHKNTRIYGFLSIKAKFYVF